MGFCLQCGSSDQFLTDRIRFISLFMLCWLALAFSTELYAAKRAEKPVAEANPPVQDNNTPATSTSPGKALVYVFRERQMHGAGEQSRVFVNDSLIGVLHLANYSSIEVPPGTTVVVATFPNAEGASPIEDLRLPNMSGAWTLLPGCTSFPALGWRQFAAAANDDLLRCESEIGKLKETCGPYTSTISPNTSTATMEDLNLTVTFADGKRWLISNRQGGGYFRGVAVDGTFVLIQPVRFPRISDLMHGGSSWVVEAPGDRNGPVHLSVPTCNFKLTELGDASTLFSEAEGLKDFHARTAGTQGSTHVSGMRVAMFQARLQFQAEAGKTYYVKYSFSANIGATTKLTLVEPKEGEKEVKHAHPIKTW
jgi:hypothetical protein